MKKSNEIQNIKEDILFLKCLAGTFYYWICMIEGKIQKNGKK